MFGFLKRSVTRFLDDDCTTMSAAIAYYTTFSIAPLLLIIIAVVGFIFGRDLVQHQIQDQIQGLIGKGSAAEVGAMVESAGKHASTGVISAVLGVFLLLAGATGAFTQLQSSLNRIWRVKPDPHAGGIKAFVGVRVLSLGMILAVAFLLVVSLAASAAISALGTFMRGYLPQGISAALLQAIGFLASFLILAALFAAMFKVLPDARIQWGDVWIGAGLTSLLFTIGKTLIGIYLGHSGVASAYGAAGSFVLIVLWINYSALIFLLGAELTAAWSEAHARPAEPKPGAVRVNLEEKVEPPPRAA